MRCKQIFQASEKALRKTMLLSAVACLGLTGCKSWLDQSELVRNTGDRLVVPVLSSIDPTDETEMEFTGAQEVTAADLKVVGTDYLIGRNDLLSVSVFDLVNGGVETVRTSRVSETGMLSLPMLGDPIKANGLTEQELQKAIVKKYKDAGILEKAQVAVTVVEARQRTFSISGAVTRPGQYAILEADFRVLNALVQAGDISNTQIEYLYVIRKLSSEKPSSQPAADEKAPTTPPATAPNPAADPLAPRVQAPAAGAPILAMMAADDAKAAAPAAATSEKLITVDGKTMVMGTTQPVAAPKPTAESPDVPAAPVAPPVAAAPPVSQPAYEFGAGLKADDDQRVIKVPLALLRNGDLRYNIVIRPNDMVIVPMPTVGYYFMGGHVGSPGVYSLTGQKITLKQAVIGARMLDGLAVPAKTDVVRRIGNNEVFVRVNLEKVFEARQPDIYLKPNDVVMVGTDIYPTFLAALRGAFRITYGFGFLYDRNYAPAQKQNYGGQ